MKAPRSARRSIRASRKVAKSSGDSCNRSADQPRATTADIQPGPAIVHRRQADIPTFSEGWLLLALDVPANVPIGIASRTFDQPGRACPPTKSVRHLLIFESFGFRTFAPEGGPDACLATTH